MEGMSQEPLNHMSIRDTRARKKAKGIWLGIRQDEGNPESRAGSGRKRRRSRKNRRRSRKNRRVEYTVSRRNKLDMARSDN